MTDLLLAPRPGAATPLPPATRATRIATRLTATLTPWLVRTLIGTAVLTFLGLAVGPHLLGYRTMTMLTGSMAPAIEPGDVTIVTPLAPADLTEGMVIAYNIPIDDHRVVSHRITDLTHNPDGTVTVQTQGDANPTPDPWQATLHGDTAWQVRAVIPELGHLIQTLHTPLLSHALLYGAPTLLAGWLLLTIWRPTTDHADVPVRRPDPA